MTKLIKNLTGEVIGFIVTGFTALSSIIILTTIGETTGQQELVKNVIGLITLLAFGVGIPLGVISIIKFLKDEFG